MKTKSQNPRPVAIATVASRLDIRIGLVKAMVKSGILRPLKTRLMIFDPAEVCNSIITQSENPALVERAQEWLRRLESEAQTLAVKSQRKTRTRKKTK